MPWGAGGGPSGSCSVQQRINLHDNMHSKNICKNCEILTCISNYYSYFNLFQKKVWSYFQQAFFMNITYDTKVCGLILITNWYLKK